MCGRASLAKQEKDLQTRFKARFYQEDIERYNPLPNYNVAPTHHMPVLTEADRTHFQCMRWGLIPHWARDERTGYKMINARWETLMEKSAFRPLLSSHRCIVPLDGFFEWQRGDGKAKTPFHIRHSDGSLFAVAGLWTTWQSSSGVPIHSFTLITLAPNKLLARIHDRMPAILLPEQEAAWLDTTLRPVDCLAMLAPYPDDALVAVPVSSRVGNVRENDAGLIEAIGDQLSVM
jgi:putative SOS response-associated peptidase YedK